MKGVSSKKLLDSKREKLIADHWISALSIEAASQDISITSLSGGNKQKVMIARCLAEESPILVLCEPTAGVDIGTRIAIYELIAAQVRKGLCVIISSSDVGDLLALCTRVIVIHEGVCVGELKADEISEASLIEAMENVGPATVDLHEQTLLLAER